MNANVRQIGDRGRGLDPKTMLLQLIEDADNFQDIAVVVRYKDDESSIWCTTGNRWFWWAASFMLGDVACKGEES